MKINILKIQIAALEKEYERLKTYFADDEITQANLLKDKEDLAWEIIKLRNELIENYQNQQDNFQHNQIIVN